MKARARARARARVRVERIHKSRLRIELRLAKLQLQKESLWRKLFDLRESCPHTNIVVDKDPPGEIPLRQCQDCGLFL